MSKPNVSNPIHDAASPGLARRLAAAFYDAWLVIALWLLGATADTFIRNLSGTAAGEGNHLLLLIYLVIAPAVFFTWFWTHGGQTLGMRTWRLKVVNDNGGILNTRQALIRLAWAQLSLLCLGLGYLWVLLDRDGLSWHDRLSHTRLVLISKAR